MIRKGLVAAALAAVVMLGSVGSADPQERYVHIAGRVQWIAGETMTLATNTDLTGSYVPQALWSVRVDLTDVPQDEYNTLTQGDFVFVTGVLVDNSWLAGTSIESP